MICPDVLQSLILLLFLITPISSDSCDSPTPAFQPPEFDHHGAFLRSTSKRIYNAIKSLSQHDEYDKTSFSVEVTSQTRTLFSIHHTARIRSSIRRGAREIGNTTAYRIASMTKPFTVLAILQQQQAGNLSLEHPVSEYVSALALPQTGSIPWEHITLRSLATQQSGIPRDFAQSDLIVNATRAAEVGLPPIKGSPSELGLPSCDSFVNYTAACTPADLLSWITTRQPLFAPDQKSTYSNINFELLGLTIANVSGIPYDEYITTRILRPLGMAGSTFTMPPDQVAAVPADIEYFWPFYMGVQNPTGGLYSSSSDLSKWLRYVMSTYNAQTRAAGNWFAPTSFSGSIATFYGMPWEIFRVRTNEIVEELKSTRPLTFITKSGGLPGYSSITIMIPEYGIGITILVAGNDKALDELRDIVSKEMVRFAEKAAMTELRARYAGTYEDEKSNSSITLAQSDKYGLMVTRWISNGVNTLPAIGKLYHLSGEEWVMHVAPTLLFQDEEKQEGERWRLILQKVTSSEQGRNAAAAGGSSGSSSIRKSVWDNFCASDWDIGAYAGKSVSELVFRGEGEQVDSVHLTGFRSTLYRKKQVDDGSFSSSSLSQQQQLQQQEEVQQKDVQQVHLGS